MKMLSKVMIKDLQETTTSFTRYRMLLNNYGTGSYRVMGGCVCSVPTVCHKSENVVTQNIIIKMREREVFKLCPGNKLVFFPLHSEP